MKLHFVGQFLVEATAVAEVAETTKEFTHGMSPSGSAQNRLDGGIHTIVFGEFRFELLGTLCSEPIEANFAVSFGDAPLGGDPTLEQNLLEGWIERTLFHPQDFRGQRMDALRNGVAMKRAGTEDAEDEKDERAGRHLVFRHRCHRDRLPMPRDWCQEEIRFAGHAALNKSRQAEQAGYGKWEAVQVFSKLTL